MGKKKKHSKTGNKEKNISKKKKKDLTPAADEPAMNAVAILADDTAIETADVDTNVLSPKEENQQMNDVTVEAMVSQPEEPAAQETVPLENNLAVETETLEVDEPAVEAMALPIEKPAMEETALLAKEPAVEETVSTADTIVEEANTLTNELAVLKEKLALAQDQLLEGQSSQLTVLKKQLRIYRIIAIVLALFLLALLAMTAAVLPRAAEVMANLTTVSAELAQTDWYEVGQSITRFASMSESNMVLLYAKMNALDVDTLNESIRDLNLVVQQISAFFGIPQP